LCVLCINLPKIEAQKRSRTFCPMSFENGDPLHAVSISISEAGKNMIRDIISQINVNLQKNSQLANHSLPQIQKSSLYTPKYYVDKAYTYNNHPGGRDKSFVRTNKTYRDVAFGSLDKRYCRAEKKMQTEEPSDVKCDAIAKPTQSLPLLQTANDRVLGASHSLPMNTLVCKCVVQTGINGNNNSNRNNNKNNNRHTKFDPSSFATIVWSKALYNPHSHTSYVEVERLVQTQHHEEYPIWVTKRCPSFKQNESISTVLDSILCAWLVEHGYDLPDMSCSRNLVCVHTGALSAVQSKVTLSVAHVFLTKMRSISFDAARYQCILDAVIFFGIDIEQMASNLLPSLIV